VSSYIQHTDNKSSYRGIFKATSLFGGVQIYQILISIIKSKFIAVLLGPVGIGIQDLYLTGTQMIQQVTTFGLSSSAVRNVSEAYGSGDKNSIGRTVTALRRLVWLTGLLGMVGVLLFSPLLSKSAFGDYVHTWGFAAISITLLLSQISCGQKVILQGTRQYKYLAKCTIYGVTIGLFVSIPLYFLWGTKAIVPNIIISSITALILSWYFARKIPIESVSLTNKETFQIGKTMLTMGVAMCLTQFLGTANSYILRSCISAWGGVAEVGLFSAGAALMTQYTGLVFQAMGTDFYPRLAAANSDNSKCREIMNQQGEVGLLLLGPLMVLCIVFIPIVIRILYSEEFYAVNNYVIWCAIGVIFQMASWSVSYVFIAKAQSKLYMINELTVGIYGLALNLLGYHFGGLTGMGISFTVKYFLYMIQVYVIAHKKYGFTYSKELLKLLAVQLFVISIGVLVVLLISSVWKYAIGSVIIIVASFISIKGLNNRLDLMSIVHNKISKKNE